MMGVQEIRTEDWNSQPTGESPVFCDSSIFYKNHDSNADYFTYTLRSLSYLYSNPFRSNFFSGLPIFLLRIAKREQ
jgi:hypothetical protein